VTAYETFPLTATATRAAEPSDTLPDPTGLFEASTTVADDELRPVAWKASGLGTPGAADLARDRHAGDGERRLR
jgi:hypothetical protein